MSYAIRRYRKTPEGVRVDTLGPDMQWYIACSKGSFPTKYQAVMVARSRGMYGPNVFIEGPRGARHKIKRFKGGAV
jgi:hypothetical protein